MDAHLRDLRYFVAVAEELNFTRAAERLHLSQPALSKQIRGLETTLRAQLFRRDRRQVELTAAGAALYAVAGRLLKDWDDGVAVVDDAAAQDARVLRVGTLTSIGRGLYPAIADQFAKRQPGWQVRLRACGWGDPTAGLRDHTADAAFVWLPIDADDIGTAVLVTERRFVAISARHPLAGRRNIEFAEIANEPVAALPASAGAQRDFWLAVDARAGRPPRVAAEVSAADEKLEIVSSGAAITLLAEGNADIYAREGIVCIPVSGLDPARLAVAWRRGDRRPALLDFVQACRDAAHVREGLTTGALRRTSPGSGTAHPAPSRPRQIEVINAVFPCFHDPQPFSRISLSTCRQLAKYNATRSVIVLLGTPECALASGEGTGTTWTDRIRVTIPAGAMQDPSVRWHTNFALFATDGTELASANG
jgi:DNA-binding transcriptional LysR family regulator